MAVTEENFPRGGKKPPQLNQLNKKSRPSFKLFGGKPKTKKKVVKNVSRKKIERENFVQINSDNITSSSAELITYKTVQEGMILLGRIRQVSKLGLRISLPGRINSLVPITHISAPYTNILKSIVEENCAPEDYQSLSKLFYVGQYVRCKVMEIEHSQNNELHKITVSISPNDIHSQWKHFQLETGFVVSAAVSSVEDHGYVMDVGIKDTRAFLPNNLTDKKLGVGEVIWCHINQCTKTDATNTLVLNAKDDKIFEKLSTNISLDNLLPGMRVKFTVKNILKDGLEGQFLDNYTGYLPNILFENSLKSTKYNVGDVLTVSVLYITPTTKLTYFTQHDISKNCTVDLQEGQTFNAKILSCAGKGFYLNLANKYKGYVSYRRLNSKKSDKNLDDILSSYIINSKHRCRVLDYDYMENVYICTFESDLIKEQYFTINDLNIGQVVQVIVDKITHNGLQVHVGRIFGFVKQFHLSDIPIQSNSIGKKYKEGQKITARVLDINKESSTVYFTLKSTLIESKLPCLSSFDNIDKNQLYEGVIVQITPKGLLIVFYGTVCGWLPPNGLNLKENESIEDIFYIGQVIKCNVSHIDKENKKLKLTLKPKKIINIHVNTLHIGEKVSGIVKNVTENELEVTVNNYKGIAYLRSLHLTEHPSFAPLLLENYKIGSKIENLVCIGTVKQKAYLSKRETPFLKEVLSLDDLQEGMLLRCSFKEFIEKGMLLFSTISGFQRYVFVPKSHITDEIIKNLENKFVKYQPIIAKVMKVKKESSTVIATTKLSECWDKTLTFGVDLLATFLSEFNYLHNDWKESSDTTKNLICNFNLGQQIKGKITKVLKNGDCHIELKNNINGIVLKEHCPTDLTEGDKIKGVILWINLIKKRAIVSLIPKHQNLIAADQSFKSSDDHNKTVKCEIIFVNTEFALGVTVDDEFKGQFVFLPTKLHYNDLKPTLSDYKLGEILFVQILKIVCDKWFVGVLKNKRLAKQDEVVKNLEKSENKLLVKELNKKLNKRTAKGDIKVEIENEKTKLIVPKSNKIKKAKEENLEITKEVVLPGIDSFWNLTNNLNNVEFEQESENEEEEIPKKKKKVTKAEKIELAKAEEEKIREKELLLADENALPTSAEQFDRLVMAKPNSSHAWISYMAYHLESTEIEKARAVANKALSTISFREEQEKLNVWIALLNLENRYGDKQTFSSTLEEAARTNDSRTIYCRALHILAESGKSKEFMELLNIVIKKFKTYAETWKSAAEDCYKLGLLEKSRYLLQRALTCLDKSQHISLIVYFAHLEVKHGNQERAETLFEQILGSYPRRVDIWCSYVDMLIKSNKHDVARKVLERAVSSKLPARKMKTLFKKFIDFEQSYGDDEAVQKVREMAVQYVQNATS